MMRLMIELTDQRIEVVHLTVAQVVQLRFFDRDGATILTVNITPAEALELSRLLRDGLTIDDKPVAR
jgi:hypothetical protein